MNKRQISVEEKGRLVRSDKPALILLGPECPEVAELKAVGFHESQIFGVDRTAENCARAGKLHPQMNIFCGQFVKFWQDRGKTEQWGYVHLDFCGQARPSMINQAVEVLDYIVESGRLRVTFSGSLARLDRVKNEAFLLEQVVSNISTAAAGRARLVDCRYYISSLSHKETYITAWWDKLDKERFF